LVPGVVQLRPEDAMVEAMLSGWRAQQAARGLAEDTMAPRERLVRRFLEFTNEYPWSWGPAHVEEWTQSLTGEQRLAPSTIRGYQTDLRLFSEYLCDARYGWAGACEQSFGTHPAPICHEWNTIAHLNDYEGSPEARPLSRAELQRFLDYADEQVDRAVAAKRKGALAAYRDATVFKVIYAWGLRRTETAKLDLTDWGRTPAGPLCETCRPMPTMTCSICDRRVPCWISQTTGQPCCRACQQRWARCVGCGQVQPIRGGTLTEPRCSTCTRPDPDFWRSCSTCGLPGRIRAGRCARCRLDERLRALLGDGHGGIRPHLRALHQALATTERPATVTAWLDRSAAPAILHGLDAGTEITHRTLDELPAGKPVEHLRAILVAIGTLATRDEHLVRLERWISQTVADRPDPDQQQLLHRYAVWHVLRRLRHRLGGTDATHAQVVGA